MHFGYENSAQEYNDKKKAFSFITVMDIYPCVSNIFHTVSINGTKMASSEEKNIISASNYALR